MPRRITPRTTLENLKREAKRWLKALRANAEDARVRFANAFPNAPHLPTLRDVQHALSRELGAGSWAELVQKLSRDEPMRRYERVADAVVVAYKSPDPGAMRVVWEYFGHMRAWDGMRRYMRLDLGRREEPETPEDDVVTLADAQYLVARAQGFENWQALTEFATSLPPGRETSAKPIGAYRMDGGEQRPSFMTRDWDELFAVMREQRIPGLHPNGQITDELLTHFSELDHITHLDLSGCRQLTDDGLRYLARLPRLTRLNLSGCGHITDRGFEVLRRLPALESFAASWTPITDAGAAHLAGCERLAEVDLGGTRTGDGALGALAGKHSLRSLSTGHEVTNEGLALLHGLPVFKTWHGGEGNALLGNGARPNQITLRGVFDDRGMERLVGLDGLYSLNIWDVHLKVTSSALAPLVGLPHLESLACEATDDAWMARIAALPHLRFLMCQDTPVGDDGFVALSKSRSIEHIWGRRCHNLQRRGFVALADMPALRYLSVSCKNVDDEGLSALPRFAALRELMPMDVPDEGYRHIGKCEQLESLVLMYCRDSGDRATEHITGLRKLTKYFASYNQITDRTPELLSEISSLESITFDSCAGLTNSGVAKLARLPRLKELNVGSMRHVTAEVVSAFPSSVQVKWSA